MKKIHPDDRTWRHGWIGLAIHWILMTAMVVVPWILVLVL